MIIRYLKFYQYNSFCMIKNKINVSFKFFYTSFHFITILHKTLLITYSSHYFQSGIKLSLFSYPQTKSIPLKMHQRLYCFLCPLVVSVLVFCNFFLFTHATPLEHNHLSNSCQSSTL